MRAAHRGVLGGAVAAVLGGAALALSYAPCTLDDAFIAFRYAVNAAAGHGLAYNAGGPPVEGFTSPLWLALLTAAVALLGKSAAPVAAACFGTLSLVLAATCAGLLAARMPHTSGDALRLPRAALACAALAMSPASQLYAATGLETVAFTLAVLCVLGAATSTLPPGPGLASAALAPWTRPEAPVLLGLLAIVALRQRARTRACLALAVTLVSSTLALLAVRYTLLGTLLPNTYYAKDPDLTRGLQYVGALAWTPWAGTLIVLAGYGAWLGGGGFTTLLLCGVCWLGAVVLEGGDWMPLGRFALPALACFAVAASGALPARAKSHRLAVALGLCALLVFDVRTTREHVARQHRMRRTLYHEGQKLAAWLTSAGVRSVALMDIGEIGYLTDLEIVDLAGLTDRTIAHAPGHHLRKRLDTAYVLDQRDPDAAIVRVERPPFMESQHVDPDAAMTQPEYDLLTSPALRARYRLLFALFPGEPRVPFYGNLVFVKKTLPLRPETLPPALVVSVPPAPE